ncbi:MAG: hypothetical protein K2Q14_08745 [Gammaproteobacteria bacterium]|nr:hypothetical protein [Gammaproteobacteria bacterium]
MKKSMALLLFVSFSAQASIKPYTVSLQVNNNTHQEVKTSGTYSYEQYGIFHSQAPLPIINKVIAPEGRNIPMDNLRRELTNYDIEYFDFYDTNNKLLAACLSTYYPLRENAIIRFSLYQLAGDNAHYHCTREVIKEKII